MRHYTANRKDENHARVAAIFKAHGCTVVDVADSRTLGCDLWVFQRSTLRFWFVEVKDGTKKPSARKLKPSEEAFRDLCSANGMPWALVESDADAVTLVRGASQP